MNLFSKQHPSTFGREDSEGGVVQTPEQSFRSQKHAGGEIQRYSRTPTAIESALSSNTPVKMDLKLFDTYKVASRLPYDIFQNICKNAVQPEVSDFSAEQQHNGDANPVHKLIS